MMSAIPAVATPNRTNPIVHGLAEMCRMMMGTAPIIRMVTAASSTSRIGGHDSRPQSAIVNLQICNLTLSLRFGAFRPAVLR